MAEPDLSHTVFVCDLAALNIEQRKQHQVVLAQMGQSIKEMKEIQNGYAFRYATDSSILLLIAEFIALERLCCPFLDFTLDVEHEDGPVWLHLTGPKGVQQFLSAEMGLENRH